MVYPDAFYIEAWQIRPALNRMVRDDEMIQLEPKVMQVLVCLADRPGEVLSRAYLMDAVWPDTVVGEDLLTRCISELRKGFDDDARDPRVIETIRKGGYRLIAPVSYETASQAGHPVPALTPSKQAASTRLQTGTLSSKIRLGIGLLAVGALAVTLWIRSPFGSSANQSAGLAMRAVPFTTFPGEERAPAFSSDGTQIAFLWDGETGGNYDLYLKLIGGATPLRLTETPASELSPTWSPDGRNIAFVRASGNTCGVFLISALGSEERRLTSCRYHVASGLSWSPDGQWLAFSEQPAPTEPFRIVLLSPQTLERREFTRPPAQYVGDQDPAFSPDGTSLAFARGRNGWAWDVFVMPVAGGDPRQLTFNNRDMVGLDWMEDGQALVYASTQGGDYALWRVSIDGGQPEPLRAPGWKIKHPALSRQGGYLAYENWNYDISIWRLPGLDGSTAPTRVISSTLWDIHPSFSSDGAQVAFASTRSGHFEIWISEADGSNPVQVTAFEGPFVGTPRWSPDNTQLAFDARPDGPADLYILDVMERIPHRLTATDANDRMPSWSHDGQWIYFSSDRSGSWQIWKVPAAGGEAVQVTLNGGFIAFEAADGAALYYTKPAQTGFWRRPLTGGDETLVLDLPASHSWQDWVLTREGIYFVQHTDDRPPTVAFYHFGSGAVSAVGQLREPIPFSPSLAVSPDGQSVLYAQIDHRESDIFLLEHVQ